MKSANAAGEMAPTDSMQGCRRPPVGENCNVWSSLGAQQAKDQELSLQWLASLLRCSANPWAQGTSTCDGCRKKKRKKKEKNLLLFLPLYHLSYGPTSVHCHCYLANPGLISSLDYSNSPYRNLSSPSPCLSLSRLSTQ